MSGRWWIVRGIMLAIGHGRPQPDYWSAQLHVVDTVQGVGVFTGVGSVAEWGFYEQASASTWIAYLALGWIGFGITRFPGGARDADLVGALGLAS